MMVEDLIYAACRIAGVLQGPNQTMSGDDVQEGVKCLNSMLDSWKIQRLTVFAILRNLFTVIASQQEYSIGNDPNAATADIPIERPPRIEGMSWFSGEVEVPMRHFTDQQWKLFSPKDATSSIATSYNYRPTVPNGTLILWPVPTTAHQIAIYSWQTLNQVAASTDSLDLPPGYQRAIEYLLALELATRYPENRITPLAVSEGRRALGWLKAMNQPEMRMAVDSAAMGSRGSRASGRYDIFSNRNL